MPLGGTVGGPTYLVDCGPSEASTSLDLDVVRVFPHDANGYYRALGVSITATRREIREAYQNLDGPNDARLTAIAKVLLNPARRAQYDSVPLGSLYYDDEVETWQRRARVDEISDLLRRGLADIADELAEADLGVSLDDLLQGGKDEPARPFQPIWEWGFFLRASSCRDVDRLRRWQELLVSHLGRRGERIRVAVGFSGVMETFWGVEQIGQTIVVFLHDEGRPTEALAQAAASRVVQHLRPASMIVEASHGDGEKVMSATPGFRKGAEEAKAASKGGANFARTEFFGLEDGKSAILRLLTEFNDFITVDQHQMVPTKGKFAGWPKDAKWPEKMGAVCRMDPGFGDPKGDPADRMFPDCYICEYIVDGKKYRASGRNWALACVREEVKEDGQIVGYRDATREVKIERDGKEETITEKRIVVVNLGYKNFFSILQGFAGRYKTWLDRDYWIKREGNDTDTTYQIVPCDPVPAKNPESGEMEILDLRQPYFMQRYKTDLKLEEVIMERASDEFYAKFFDKRYDVVEQKDGDKHVGYTIVPADSAEAKEAKKKSSSSESSGTGGDSDVDPEKLAALAQRVRPYRSDDEGSEAPAEEKAAPAAEETSEAAPAAAGGGMRDFDS